MQREPLADDGAPAAGAERHFVFLFLAAGTEQPFLEDEGGLIEIFDIVDAADLIGIVELETVHLQTGTQKLLHAVGQAQFRAAIGLIEAAQSL